MPRHAFILQQVAAHGISRARNVIDYAYAIGTGTAIGYFANPEVREIYELWKGKDKMSYDDKFVRKKTKGDVVIGEGNSTQREALHPEDAFYRTRGGFGSYTNRGRSSRRKYGGRKRFPNKNWCYCKSRIHRNVDTRSKYKPRRRYGNFGKNR